jgi:hypothetical protein
MPLKWLAAVHVTDSLLTAFDFRTGCSVLLLVCLAAGLQLGTHRQKISCVDIQLISKPLLLQVFPA